MATQRDLKFRIMLICTRYAKYNYILAFIKKMSREKKEKK